MKDNQFVRAYSIKEVSKKLRIPTGTIRQWEKDLNGVLRIPRTAQGTRYFTDKEIELLNKIKEMREKNVGKEMIRNLLEKYLAESSFYKEPSSSLAVLDLQNRNEQTKNLPLNQETSITQDVKAQMETFKQELNKVIRDEFSLVQKEIVDQIKNELSATALHTVKELSKSIQRSNDKRQKEVQQITDKMHEVSEHASESFATLSQDIANHSQAVYEQIQKRINESSKIAVKEQKNTFNKVNRAIAETRNDITYLANSLDRSEERLLEIANELKESVNEIQEREEIFRGMIASFREAAPAKSKRKKWWQVWS